jgi:TonB family protein
MLLNRTAEKSAHSSHSIVKENFGSLSGCMVEGNPEQRIRERFIRRLSLGLSVGLQALFCAVVLIVPLFGKAEKISYVVTPLPPYGPPQRHHETVRHNSHAQRTECTYCFSFIRPISPTRNVSRNDNTPGNSEPPGFGDKPGTGLIPMEGPGWTPQPPDDPTEKLPKRVHVGTIEPAMLTRKIEPIYPALARQIGRAGRVELHAVIAVDGSVQSLEVVEGDPLLVRSALDAVSQWHYKPTILNGQAVEVDTHISVIYSMPR